MTKIVEFTSDGAWCWFQDPRAIYINGKHKKTYAQWMTHDGKLQCGSYNHETEKIFIYTLREQWDRDDHNVGSFLVLQDNRIMVFYARHNKYGLFCRTTKNPEDITQWEDEILISNQKKVTYSHPIFLKNEKKFFVFWRGVTWKPTYSTSKDGIIWTEPKILIQDEGRSQSNIRPYTKVYSNGNKAIHIVFTDGHPRNEPQNSVYYLRYENGKFKNLSGDFFNIDKGNPIPHSKCDKIYDAGINNARAWVWDVNCDEKDNPCVLYTRLPSRSDHRYHYARWDGTQWFDKEIIASGKWFPQTKFLKVEREPHYSAGLSFNKSNPNIIYLSRQINNNFEIEKWKTGDLGKNWISSSITSKSKGLNVRPVYPCGYAEDFDHILWMSGKYRHYTRFKTKIVFSIDK